MMPEVSSKVSKDWKYQVGTKEAVPKSEFRCKATTVKPGVNGRPSNTHPCRSVEDHKADHICICGHTWSKTPNKENAS